MEDEETRRDPRVRWRYLVNAKSVRPMRQKGEVEPEGGEPLRILLKTLLPKGEDQKAR